MKDKTSTVNIKVEYSHTDKMGYVHHSQYFVYYEFARWEFLRNLGISYKNIEDNGVMIPVIHVKSKYLKPAFYDDTLKINTTLNLDGAKLIFRHEIINDRNELINIAEIKVACIDSDKRKPIKPMKNILNLLNLNSL
jgi:acyl-CoA thioester hydrolase